MLTISRPRAAVVGCALVALIGAGSAHAATTFAPNRFDDPPSGGMTCTPPAPANACSLRGAVAAAQTGDTVRLAAGTYTLSQGRLDLTNLITVAGAGPHATTIRQTAQDRVISVSGAVGLTMHDLTVTGGHVVGVAGPDGATPGASGGNGGGASGAGIGGGGAMTLTDVVVTGNTATGGAGGAGHSGAGAGGAGGAGGTGYDAGISSGSSLTLTRVAVANNVAHGGPAGAGGPAGTSGAGGAGGNGGSAFGAGIGVGLGGTLVARDTLIAGNQAIPGAGGTGGLGGTTTGVGGAGGQGGVASGGGLFANGVIKLTNVTFSGNSAFGSSGAAGGAARSTTIATAGGAGGAGWGGTGGAAALWNPPPAQAPGQFASVTVAANSGTEATGGAGGAGGHSGPAGATGTIATPGVGNLSIQTYKLTMRDSIVASGLGHSGTENCSIVSGGVVTSAGHNLEDRNQCIAVPAAGDLHDKPAGLGPLQDNGGPTPTMALLPGSAAIGAGFSPCLDALAAPLSADQRGLTRGAPCDIGAFDGQAPSVTAPPAIAGVAMATRTVTCSGQFSGDSPQTSAVEWLRDGAPVATGPSYTVAAADVGHALSCRQTVSNAFGSATATSAAVTALALTLPPVPAKPKLSGLSLSPGKPRNRHKATVSFTLGGAEAKVTFVLQRQTKGVKAGKRCVKRSSRNRHGKSCTRWVSAGGAPKPVAAKLGTTKVTWMPRGLKLGRYRLTATPAGGGGITITFTVRR